MTTVAEARSIARMWVEENARGFDGYSGAFLVGSIAHLDENSPVPHGSDIDIIIVTQNPDSQDQPGPTKLIYNGLLLERAICPKEWFLDKEGLLAEPNFACHFHRNNIIEDPLGILSDVHQFISRNYTKRKWVEARCLRLQERILTDSGGEGMMLGSGDLCLQTIGHGMVVSGIAQLPLIANLENPTYKKCLVRARTLLPKAEYSSLLQLLGSESLGRVEVDQLHAECLRAYGKSLEVKKTSFFGDSDIARELRPYIVETLSEMARQNNHRESVLWVMDVHSSAVTAIQNDGTPADKESYLTSLQDSLRLLGIGDGVEFGGKAEDARSLVPRVMETAMRAIRENTSISD